MRKDDLSADEMESLRQISDAGAQDAGSAISQITGLDFILSAPGVRALPVDDVPALLGGAEAAVVALHLSVFGDTRGNILIAMEPQSAGRLLDALLPGRAPTVPLKLRDLPEMEQSGLLEMGNILAGAYLSAVSRHLHRSLLASVPRLAIDMAGAVVDTLVIEASRGRDSALVIQTELLATGGDIIGHILFLPDPLTLPDVLKALRRPLASEDAEGV